MAEYKSGFGGLSPELLDFQVRDLWQADKHYFIKKYPYLTKVQPITDDELFKEYYTGLKSYEKRLASEDMQTKVHILEEMYNISYSNTELLDSLAQQLVKKSAEPEDASVQYLAWIAKVLGASQQPQYEQTLSTVIQQTTSSKIKKHAQNSLEMLKRLTS